MPLQPFCRRCSPGVLALGWVVGGFAFSAWGEEAAPPTAPAETVQQLITQLGSDEFSAREAASDKLAKLGPAALTALEGAAGNPDREIRFRAERVLGTIREQDLQRRLEVFLSGESDSGEYALPAWTAFKKIYGDEQAARELFVEMQRADAALLAALEKGAQPGAEALSSRVQQQQQAIQQGVATLGLGQIAAILFVAGDEQVALQVQTTSSVLGFCHQQSLREAVAGGKFQEIPRKMLGSLIRKSDDWAAYNAMMIAFQYNLSEGLVPAVKVLGNPVNRAPHMTQYALLTVAKLGDESHLPLVEKLLGDKVQLLQMQQNNVRYDVQVRDAALATTIFLHKQPLKNYFPAQAERGEMTDPQQVFFNIRALGFSSEDERAAVHTKWAKFLESKKPAREAGK